MGRVRDVQGVSRFYRDFRICAKLGMFRVWAELVMFRGFRVWAELGTFKGFQGMGKVRNVPGVSGYG